MLPAGEKYTGELSEQMIGLDEDSQTGPLQLLTGERIFLASSSNPEFSPLWQPLLDTTGAKVRVKPARNGLYIGVFVILVMFTATTVNVYLLM